MKSVNHGAILTSDRFGNPNSAYQFNGAQYIEIPYNSKLNVANSFSFSVWAKSDKSGLNYSEDGFILDCGFVADRGFGLLTHAGKNRIFPYYNLCGLDTIHDPILDTLWHHYVVTFNGTKLDYYFDNKKVSSTITTIGTIDPYPFRIGSQSKESDRYFYGKIDDIIVFNKAISEEYIAGLYASKGFKARSSSSIVEPVNKVKGLSASITGTSGNLKLTLTWNPVSSAFAYGVYYSEGATVTKNDYYRIAQSNQRTFTTELTENKVYTFAVIYSTLDGTESVLSDPLTISFKAQ